MSRGNVTENQWGDDYAYFFYAMKILNGQMASECCSKNYGYSFFLLAPVIHFFGPDNMMALRLIQIGLDTITSLLVYFCAKKLFPEKAAFIAFLIYLTNPNADVVHNLYF